MMAENPIVIQGLIKESPYQSFREAFIFDSKSLQSFKDFWQEIIPPKIEKVDNWACKCPKCSSNNCHNYKDYLVCFECYTKWQLPVFKLKVINGYLAKYKIDNPQDVVYFHRFLMEKELRKFLNYGEKLVVHHINGNKKDNRIENLKIMSEQEHKIHHAQQAYRRGLATFCEKKYGSSEYCGEHSEEYDEWLANKFDSFDYE